MVKIGRNDMCPCGSGRKFKRCCIGKTASPEAGIPAAVSKQVTLRGEIEKTQQAAVDGREMVYEYGVFVFFTTKAGDAWLLEVSGSDALRLAAGGEKLAFELTENAETIEVNWSHTFKIMNKQFEIASYLNKKTEILEDYPTHAIAAAVKRIKRKFSPTLLDQVHVSGA